MAEYDTISKHLIQTYPKDFIQFTLGHEDVEVLDILDAEQPTVETRHTDSLIRVHIAGKEALVHHAQASLQRSNFKRLTIHLCAWLAILYVRLSITTCRFIPV